MKKTKRRCETAEDRRRRFLKSLTDVLNMKIKKSNELELAVRKVYKDAISEAIEWACEYTRNDKRKLKRYKDDIAVLGKLIRDRVNKYESRVKESKSLRDNPRR